MNLADHVQGEGTTWVFLHGWGMNQGIWTPLCDAFPPDQRLVTVNLPGYGGSAWHSSLTDFDKAVEALESQLLEQINSPCYLVGWSMGGLFAQALAVRQRLEVNGLVLVGSTPKFTEAKAWPGIQPKVLSMFQQQLKRDFAATIHRFLAVQAMGSPQTREDIRNIQALLARYPDPNPNALTAGLSWLEHIDLRSEFQQLACPTLRIYGRRDTLVPVEQASLLTKAHDQQLIYEQSAHTPFLNESTRFIDDLQGFHANIAKR